MQWGEGGRESQKAQGCPLLPVSGDSMAISEQDRKEGQRVEGPARAVSNGWRHTPVGLS